MIDLDVLLSPTLPTMVQAAIAQACTTVQRAPWAADASGRDVIPVRLPDGVWLTLDLPIGQIGVGFEQSTIAIRAPAAVVWMLRRTLPTRSTAGVGWTATLYLDVRPGAEVWSDALSIGLRWATPIELNGSPIV